jgi:hypothetical protein
MRQQELYDALKATGLPVAYRAFRDESSLPYVLYWFERSGDLMADDGNYAEIQRYVIELYADRKSLESERAVERALADKGLSWSKYEVWIEAEKMILVSYTTDMIGE